MTDVKSSWTKSESIFGEPIFQRPICNNGQVVITVGSEEEAAAFDRAADRFFCGVALEDHDDWTAVHSFCTAWEYAMTFAKAQARP